MLWIPTTVLIWYRWCHPGVELRANLESISNRCHLFEIAFVWELTKETLGLPLGCLQGGFSAARSAEARSSHSGLRRHCSNKIIHGPYGRQYRRDNGALPRTGFRIFDPKWAEKSFVSCCVGRYATHFDDTRDSTAYVVCCGVGGKGITSLKSPVPQFCIRISLKPKSWPRNTNAGPRRRRESSLLTTNRSEST